MSCLTNSSRIATRVSMRNGISRIASMSAMVGTGILAGSSFGGMVSEDYDSSSRWGAVAGGITGGAFGAWAAKTYWDDEYRADLRAQARKCRGDALTKFRTNSFGFEVGTPSKEELTAAIKEWKRQRQELSGLNSKDTGAADWQIEVAEDALATLEENRGDDVFVAKSKNGIEAIGIGSYMPPYKNEKAKVHLSFLATAPKNARYSNHPAKVKGAGTSVLQHFARLGSLYNCGVELSALKGAETYYGQQGFEEKTKAKRFLGLDITLSRWQLDPQQTRKFATAKGAAGAA